MVWWIVFILRSSLEDFELLLTRVACSVSSLYCYFVGFFFRIVSYCAAQTDLRLVI